MKERLAGITAVFAAIIITLTAVFCISGSSTTPQETQSEYIVAVNEIEQLIRSGNSDEAAEKASELQQIIRSSGVEAHSHFRVPAMGVTALFFVLVIFGYVYFAILHPFDKLENWAEKIAHGDFNVPLNYERSNYFGKFTWAFDSMRREITKARSCEREAIENNKTVIATLSHDIKTPIASIRAYAEGLEANLDGTPERRAKYLSVLMRKCDEVSKLTNDLFLHSLSDLDKLKINPEEFELCEFMTSVTEEIVAEQNDVHFKKPEFTAVVCADKNRLMQIAENLINNARKYAKSDVYVNISLTGRNAEIHFRDYGAGIPDEDMPFIFDEFYRGKNCGDEQGSGLGLYIVKYIAEKMGGKALLHNHSDGLEATIILPIYADN